MDFPLNHNKQECKMFPNNNHVLGFDLGMSVDVLGRDLGNSDYRAMRLHPPLNKHGLKQHPH